MGDDLGLYRTTGLPKAKQKQTKTNKDKQRLDVFVCVCHGCGWAMGVDWLRVWMSDPRYMCLCMFITGVVGR